MKRERGLGLALLLASVSLGAPASADTLDFVHAESNAGGSAGGHAAVRIGAQVYDFRNADLGTLRLSRSSWEDFRYRYSVLGNRTLHVARVDVPSEAHDAISRRFNRRYLVERQHFERLEATRADRQLAAWLLGASAYAPLIEGAALFAPNGAPAASNARGALKARIDRELGEAFLRDRARAIVDELRALAPAPVRSSAPLSLDAPRDTPPVAEIHFSQRHHALAQQLFALRVVAEGLPVRPKRLRTVSGSALREAGEERRALHRYAAWLETSLVGLLQSQRPDWGYPVLLGLARVAAIERSLDRGRLVVLDVYADGAQRIEPAELSRRQSFVNELAKWAEREYDQAFARFTETGPGREPAYAWLEEAANRHDELRRGLAEHRTIRLQEAGRLPAPGAPVADLPRPTVSPDGLQRALAQLTEAERAASRELRSGYRYDLFEANCVTELFATIAAAGATLPRRSDGLSAWADFIPFVAHASIEGATVEHFEIPSYRRVLLEASYASGNDLAVYLRESNTLTSTAYRWTPFDSFFIFFTDDVVALRPLFGAINIVAGVGETAFGILRAPFDRGATLWSGLKGIAFSLPELVFANIRKGVLEYGPGDEPRTSPRAAGASASSSRLTRPDLPTGRSRAAPDRAAGRARTSAHRARDPAP